MQRQHVSLPVADGSSMQVFTVLPDGPGPFPGLILIQEAYGVNGHIRHVGERLAAEGFAVIAPEIFHRTAPAGWEGPYGDFQAVMPHYQAITVDGLEQDMRACYQWFQEASAVASDRIGAIGFCLGGRVSFVANACLPLRAAVSYYGGMLDKVTDLAPKVSGPHLFQWGGLDKHLGPEVREAVTAAMTAAGKPFASVVYSYADHAFNCDERPAYQPDAANESWALSMAFLKGRMG
jgi:carboxymethylenebutenolidase